MTTLLIELHSFSRNYLQPDRMPFLSGLAERFGLGELVPPFGYDALTSLWTGVWPERHGHFAKYAYHGVRKPSPLEARLPNWAATVLLNFQRWLRGEDFLTRFAPDRRSRYFRVERRYHYPHMDAFAVPTLFDYLRRATRSYVFFEWPLIAVSGRPNRHRLIGGDDAGRIAHFRRLRRAHGAHLYFLMLKDMDRLGHRYGPFSSEVRAACQRIDRLLADLLDDFSLDTDNILCMSSYGMLPVHKHVDLGRILPPFGDGYVYFLDSTMARFWFWEDHARARVESTLAGADSGRIIPDEELKRHHAFFPDRRFGELIFMTYPGTVIHPDFYHGTPPRGMHTYDLTNRGGHEFGAVICNRPLQPAIRSVDITPTLLALMGLPIPPGLDGEPVLHTA